MTSDTEESMDAPVGDGEEQTLVPDGVLEAIDALAEGDTVSKEELREAFHG